MLYRGDILNTGTYSSTLMRPASGFHNTTWPVEGALLANPPTAMRVIKSL